MQLNLILQFFAHYIETQLGIVYAEHNYFQLENRLEEIAKLLGVPNVEKLFEQAQVGIHGAFRQLLLDVATNNETSFFRDPRVFTAIENCVIPDFLQKARPDETFRIWSAAASTGQEALSLAMLIEEHQTKKFQKFKYSILSTDISERVLARANCGEYSQLEVQRGLPAPMLIKYFTKGDQDRWTASPDLRNKIRFQKQNLKESFPFSAPYNLILCRNVLIYQSIESKIEILKRITETLVPGGFLILGSGESLMGLTTDYEQTGVDGAVIYRRRENLALAA